MKNLKFTPDLAKLILEGKKTATWRFFDDKDLKVGDDLELVNKDTGEVFAQAVITLVKEKPLGKVGEEDFCGHETYQDKEEMLTTYRGYYGDRVDWDTLVKMIHFKLGPKT
ncbi:hypothetical protein COU14_00470 [Candidatus Kaiserbacteria bacterium CG10_big_fil_rev_8_21_14_0_10_44_10]|uniref:ASCH domain-containing protein n=1 Tax=Candidatus Kaiserbacteria bacterium CG10_big_fil_rev_8_21_14_0_10_44_10 TaxID=1974606 RepID=A0A2H0UIE5_9BACT|nr:MAG: hypothetical protein COU14_00470 [Candidatus Kaiserbacteria bacterium CG10_big_fil_rev_8_21_14_0_10_44_10]